jgi:hypothetical protein
MSNKIEKVALYSKNNIFMGGVGSLNIGYNIVTKEKSEIWLQNKSVRLASAEEVARAYGKKI